MKKQSVVFLNRFYWPDHAATAQILSDLTTFLARRDWDVTVIAAGATYSGPAIGAGANAASGAPAMPRTEMHDGVSVRRTRAAAGNRASTAGSMKEYASYTAGALAQLASAPRHSVVVSMTDPPLLAAAVMPVARLKRSRFVHWVQDIHPDVAARVGALPSSGVASSSLHALARATYRNADMTVTIGPVMAAHLRAEGVPADRMRVIPNWVDTQAVKPIDGQSNALMHELGLDGKFVVLYSGNAARSHPLGAVLEAMRQLRDEPDVVFMFVGSGPGHAQMKAAAESEGLTQCRFLPSLPRERIAESHSLAAACLVTESTDVAGLLYPSKSIGIIASARPLLFIGSPSSEVAKLVQQFDCGVVFDSGNVADDGNALVREIGRLRADKSYREKLGENGRRAAVEHFDVRAGCEAWNRLLTSLV